MRLWHKCLIPYLPRQQLLGQWRELCLIAKEIHEKGTVHHILVKPVMEYPLSHFRAYAVLVQMECAKRGYKIRPWCFWKYFPDVKPVLMARVADDSKIYPEWHNNRYLSQCLANLQEKYDRGGIPEEEWKRLTLGTDDIYYRQLHIVAENELARRKAFA